MIVLGALESRCTVVTDTAEDKDPYLPTCPKVGKPWALEFTSHPPHNTGIENIVRTKTEKLLKCFIGKALESWALAQCLLHCCRKQDFYFLERIKYLAYVLGDNKYSCGWDMILSKGGLSERLIQTW